MAKVKPQAVIDLDNKDKPVKVKIKGEIKNCLVADIRSDVYMTISTKIETYVNGDEEKPRNRYKIVLIEEN